MLLQNSPKVNIRFFLLFNIFYNDRDIDNFIPHFLITRKIEHLNVHKIDKKRLTKCLNFTKNSKKIIY
ncbi:unnamed protein product [Commensalibacter communis]|uniref:Uncharacterized protein n=1 Tax=Commensalibacter communis TaxID=2972786 RepID=A0ABM9HSQ7_9PROT|nr:unnamed protein product [Commensalibacter communis]CAI3952960.1 unnamed protein product [Commensalibacter communis]CAI3960209.1 unnamed protein product [Commensalibacter communis]